jgi:hypothetical protein
VGFCVVEIVFDDDGSPADFGNTATSAYRANPLDDVDGDHVDIVRSHLFLGLPFAADSSGSRAFPSERARQLRNRSSVRKAAGRSVCGFATAIGLSFSKVLLKAGNDLAENALELGSGCTDQRRTSCLVPVLHRRAGSESPV